MLQYNFIQFVYNSVMVYVLDTLHAVLMEAGFQLGVIHKVANARGERKGVGWFTGVTECTVL